VLGARISLVAQPEPVWNIRTEAELQQAIDNGLTETHYVDFKRELEDTKKANKDLAQDVAALAVDGGTLIIGVDEEEEGAPPRRTPVNLANLAERVIQVAGMRPDEGVPVRTFPVPSADDPSRGYLFVRVFPSPRAPHMVDGKYYGRTDKTNRPLSDAEVERLIAQRLTQQKDMLAVTREALDGLLFDAPDPVPPMMVLLAEPIGGFVEDPLVPLTTLDDAARQLAVLELVSQASLIDHQQGFLPIAPNTVRVVRRTGGVAATTNTRDNGLWLYSACSEILFEESGTILLTSRAPVIQPNSTKPNQIVESLIVGHTDLVVRLAPLLSERYSFAGAWRFGLVVTGTRDGVSNALAHVAHTHWGMRGASFNKDAYERATSASLLELAQSPEEVVSRLVSSLLRSLDSYQLPHWNWLLS
jgi:hypothetical protein